MNHSSYIREEQIDPDLIQSLHRTRTALIVSFFVHTIALGLVGYLLAQ